MELTTNIAIESSSAKDNLCLLENISSVISDRALDEVLKRALEKTCNIESPASKKQKKESWDFCEPAKVVVWPPPSAIESAKRKAISCLGGLTEDNRRAKIANMLQKASDMAKAVGKLDPEVESRPNGRRRFQRRNSFVIHRNRKGTGTLPPPPPSTTKIAYPLNIMREEADGALGLHPHESTLFFRRMSVSWSHSLNHSNHSTRSSSSCAK
jgi:hypothetical protein